MHYRVAAATSESDKCLWAVCTAFSKVFIVGDDMHVGRTEVLENFRVDAIAMTFCRVKTVTGLGGELNETEVVLVQREMENRRSLLASI
jgi:hypothetical protein